MKFLQLKTRFFLVFCLFLGIGLLVVLIFPWTQSPDNIVNMEVLIVDSSMKKEPVYSRAPFEEYEKVFIEKDIFQSSVNFGKNELSEDRKGDGRPESFLVKEYKVVGIIIDKNPGAVLENIATKEAVFLSEGEKISEAVVTKILPGKVELMLDGDIVTMTP